MTDEKQSACDRTLARYREKIGPEHWKGADDILFRAAWNEGAAERERQETETRLALLDRAEELTRELELLRAALSDKALVLERYAALRALLRRLDEYASTFGKDLVPHGPDSYGEGVRAVKGTIKTIIAKGLPDETDQ